MGIIPIYRKNYLNSAQSNLNFAQTSPFTGEKMYAPQPFSFLNSDDCVHYTPKKKKLSTLFVFS